MRGAVFHRLDHAGVLRALEEWAAGDLAARPEVREARLIGSLARGDWSPRSDADVVLIVDSVGAVGPFRGAEYAPGAGVPVPVDLLVYTPDEASAWRSRFRDEFERGLPLYRRPR